MTVTGKKAFPFEQATAQAMRYAQSCTAEIRFTRQPAHRLSLLNYRIFLRTVGAGIDGVSDYSTVYHTRYENESVVEPGTEPFQKLVCEYNGGVIGEKQIATGTGETIIQMEEPKLETLKADTFDWWVPVPDPAVQGQGPTNYLSDLRSLGWGPATEHTSGGSASSGNASGGFGQATVEGRALALEKFADTHSNGLAPDGSTRPPPGQRRERVRSDIKVRYSIRSEAHDVIVTIEPVSKVDDDLGYRFRNADIFLVVEETLGSGQVLHTAFPVPLTGQITYVPESFFEQERAAIEASNSWWWDLVRKYAESREISPIDPIAQFTDRMVFAPGGIERLAAVVRAEQPQFLARYLREHPPREARPPGHQSA